MRKQAILLFLFVPALFIMSCNNSNSQKVVTTDDGTNHLRPFATTSLGGVVNIRFGNGNMCNNQGICSSALAVTPGLIPATFFYTSASSVSPSTLYIIFSYKNLFVSQPDQAKLFYNVNPPAMQTYSFTSNYNIDTLGGQGVSPFASINATIQTTLAGIISLNPIPAPGTQPAQVGTNTFVVLTYTVTP